MEERFVIPLALYHALLYQESVNRRVVFYDVVWRIVVQRFIISVSHGRWGGDTPPHRFSIMSWFGQVSAVWSKNVSRETFLLQFFVFFSVFCIGSSNSGAGNTAKMPVFCSTNRDTGISLCPARFCQSSDYFWLVSNAQSVAFNTSIYPKVYPKAQKTETLGWESLSGSYWFSNHNRKYRVEKCRTNFLAVYKIFRYNKVRILFLARPRCWAGGISNSA